MELSVGLISLLLIIANVFFSYRGFKERAFFERYIFHVERILAGREYRRLLGSAFLHANWGHLFFNMFALYSFSVGVESIFGRGNYVLIYFGSLIAGNLLALYIHRNHGDYRAVGASGAVSGIIFSSVLMFPGSSIMFLFLPVAIPSWLFGIGFILVSIYGIGSRFGKLGHEAHLGGAISGVILTIILRPELITSRPLLVFGILLPIVLFMVVLLKKPEYLFLDMFVRRKVVRFKEKREVDREENLQEELDRLLEKVSRKGIDGLSDRERKRLREISSMRRKN